MSTIITGDFTVGPGQTLDLTGADLDTIYSAAFLMLDGAAAPSFVDYGAVQLASTRLDAIATGIREVSSSGGLTGTITIAQGAAFSVSTSDFRASVIGVSDGIVVENDGTISVSTGQGNLGGPGGVIHGVELAQSIPGSAPVSEFFMNTGMLTVDGGILGTAVIGSAGQYQNDGTIHVQSIAAVGISVSVLAGAATIDNRGSIIAVDNTHSVAANIGAATIGIAISGIGGASPDTDWYANPALITNSGTIQADFAVETFDTFGARILLVNSGVLDGDVMLGAGAPASLGRAAGSHIINNGSIKGLVTLEVRGDDLYDGRGGTLAGVLHFGGGVDRVLLGDDGEVIAGQSGASLAAGLVGTLLATGGAGADTIVGGAGNDTIDGGGGDDDMDGGGGINAVSYASARQGVTVSLALQGQAQITGAGSDTLANFQTLIGSAYNDTLEGGGSASTTLTGGVGADTFVYQAGDGNVTITDFSHAQGDVIDLSHLGYFFNLSELNGFYSSYALYAVPAAAQVGADTVITLGSGSLRLAGVSLSSLTAADFKFSAGPTVGPSAGGSPQTAPASGGTVTGSSGDDWLLGLSGNDTLHGGSGSDYLDGGPGLNTVTYDGAFRQYNVGVFGGVGGVSGGPEGGTDDLVNIQRIQFVDGYFATSPTDTAGQVYRVYEATLGRAPDPEGLANWVHALNGGTSLQTVVNGFVSSREFQSKYGSLSDSAFVTLLYQNLLHRAPDAAGLNNWLSALGSGQTRAQVVTGFTESGEDVHDLVGPVQAGLWIQDDAAAQAARLYDTVFGRLPDAGGLVNWTRSLEGGMTLQTAAADFVASQEFQSKYGNLGNTAFVTLLYQNVLHRPPDTSGLNNWVGYLNSGQDSRAQVVLGFSESQEHMANTAPHIDNGVWIAG